MGRATNLAEVHSHRLSQFPNSHHEHSNLRLSRNLEEGVRDQGDFIKPEIQVHFCVILRNGIIEH